MSIDPRAKAALVGSTAMFLSTQSATAHVNFPAMPQAVASTINSGKISQAQMYLGRMPLEVAPAGTYKALLKSIENYKSLHEQGSIDHSAVSYAPVTWDLDVDEICANLLQESLDNGYPHPTDTLMRQFKEVIELCAEEYTSEPNASCSENAEIEIYLKEGAKALLIVAQPEGYISVFGDEPGEQWRARFKLGGTVWKKRLAASFRELMSR